MPANRQTKDALLHAYKFGTLSGLNTAKSVPAADLFDSVSQADVVAITFVVETQSVRYRLDAAVAPTAAVGMLVAAAQTFTIYGKDDCTRFSVIEVAASAAISYTCFR